MVAPVTATVDIRVLPAVSSSGGGALARMAYGRAAYGRCPVLAATRSAVRVIEVKTGSAKEQI
jgi:hypothetical protein